MKESVQVRVSACHNIVCSNYKRFQLYFIFKVQSEYFQIAYIFSSYDLLYLFSYLGIYSLFNDAVSRSDYAASSDELIVHNELERIWEERAVT
jgi:hypothetical protein